MFVDRVRVRRNHSARQFPYAHHEWLADRLGIPVKDFNIACHGPQRDYAMLSRPLPAIGTSYTGSRRHRWMEFALRRVGPRSAPVTGNQRCQEEQKASSCAHLRRAMHEA
jgi:hypothetical protein